MGWGGKTPVLVAVLRGAGALGPSTLNENPTLIPLVNPHLLCYPTTMDSIAVHLGKRIRLRRQLMGMTQKQFASQLNLSYQQIQKYERGANPPSSATLFRISIVLKIPIQFFYEDYQDDHDKSLAGSPIPGGGLRADQVPTQTSEGETPAICGTGPLTGTGSEASGHIPTLPSEIDVGGPQVR